MKRESSHPPHPEPRGARVDTDSCRPGGRAGHDTSTDRPAGIGAGPAGFLLAAVLLIATALLPSTGCSTNGSRFAKHFDPYSTNLASLTNLTTVDGSNRIDPRWLVAPTNAFRLGPGDQIDIELLGEEEGPESAFVGPDGRIYYHLLPGVQVWGLTLEQTRGLLEKELQRYVRKPQIGITLREVHSQRVWVMGRINTPGIYPLDTPMTVLEAISKAGGLFTSRFSGTTEELADLHHSFIMRRGQLLPINFHSLIRQGETSQNIYLEPDDFIYLPSSLSGEVYVLGAVSQPRAVGYKDQVTLVSAIANARGTTKDAWLRHVAIVRGSLTEPKLGIVDYQEILRGKAPDVRLEPRDIVFVPYAPYRTMNSYMKMIVSTFVKTMAANEGGRAVDAQFKGSGITIPIQQ